MANTVTRVYSNFRGCDFRSSEVNVHHSPDCLNMWKDYSGLNDSVAPGSICTRPGMIQEFSLPDKVHGIFFYNGRIIVHSGKKLYIADNGGVLNVLYDETELRECVSSAFIYNEIWYFRDGEHYLKYDGSSIDYIEGYIPTTTIGRKPEGGGSKYEDVNMLSDYRINSFLSDGKAKTYNLDVKEIDEDFLPTVMVDDAYVLPDRYTVDYEKGSITFNENAVPGSPLTAGRDNVVIKFKKEVPEYKKLIYECSLVQIFDNRVFLSGSPDAPSMLWHSSLNDPSYFSDLDYYREGMDEAAIRSMVAGNNALWVFREPSDANTTVFYHNPALDEEYGKVYPSVHSSITLGCVGRAINFNDDIVFFSERGMEGISGDITTEQVVGHRSTLIDSKLLKNHDAYKNMVLAEWEGYLFVFVGKTVFLADSRAVFQNENHIEYDWFMWELEKTVYCAVVHDRMLYLGTDDGVYKMSDIYAEVESYWVTPADKFGYPNKLKTTNKRGCVAEATGDIDVYAKIEDTDFELIGSYNDISDYFVSRIKRKKFKDLQLKFYTKTRFCLESVSLECFVGGYIKR